MLRSAEAGATVARIFLTWRVMSAIGPPAPRRLRTRPSSRIGSPRGTGPSMPDSPRARLIRISCIGRSRSRTPDDVAEQCSNLTTYTFGKRSAQASATQPWPDGQSLGSRSWARHKPHRVSHWSPRRGPWLINSACFGRYCAAAAGTEVRVPRNARPSSRTSARTATPDADELLAKLAARVYSRSGDAPQDALPWSSG